MQIRGLRQYEGKVSSNRELLILLLVTPVHFPAINEEFINLILNKHVKRRSADQEAHILLGVVDKIGFTIFQKKWFRETAVDTHLANGVEGISIAVLRKRAAAPDLWSDLQDINTGDGARDQRYGNLIFDIRTVESSTKVRLPLAKTIFLNGRPSTLIAQRWHVKSWEEADQKPHQLVEEKALLDYTVILHFLSPVEPPLMKDVHSRLQPITQPRKVGQVVGNVIRTIRSEQDGSEEIPASQELEAAVRLEIAENHLSQKKPQVWAMIRPSSARQKTRNEVPLTIEAIATGCHLHRVLGGGGGWGNKKGLISLASDPDSDARTEYFSFDPLKQDAAFMGKEIFPNVAQEGDEITFLANNSLRSHPLVTEAKGRSKLRDRLPKVDTLIQFGTLPSAEDVGNIGDQASKQDLDLRVFKKRFGMLTQEAMSIEVSIHREQSDRN